MIARNPNASRQHWNIAFDTTEVRLIYGSILSASMCCHRENPSEKSNISPHLEKGKNAAQPEPVRTLHRLRAIDVPPGQVVVVEIVVVVVFVVTAASAGAQLARLPERAPGQGQAHDPHLSSHASNAPSCTRSTSAHDSPARRARASKAASASLPPSKTGWWRRRKLSAHIAAPSSYTACTRACRPRQHRCTHNAAARRRVCFRRTIITLFVCFFSTSSDDRVTLPG